ncbi:hypothetical protein BMETH_201_1 [methanotrophic bacterial endosymbiont of Bathymodiolus sp.]|nr:hypothetical protein BMETH_201_1 [methanotrophic bacterial endosymbiont of Bathymodiolus sp.]
MACSMPPIYWSTGSQYLALASSMESAVLLAKRAKYQDDSIKVSKVSVSRFASFPHFGQSTCKKAPWVTSGEFEPSSTTSLGNSTGKSVSGTGTVPQSSQ